MNFSPTTGSVYKSTLGTKNDIKDDSLMQTSKMYMEAANAAVRRLPAEKAVAQHGAKGTTFVDVHDSPSIAQTEHNRKRTSRSRRDA